MDYMTPAQFEDEMNKLIAEGFNEDAAINLMLEVLNSHGYFIAKEIDKNKKVEIMLNALEHVGYSAGVKAFKEAGKHCGMDFCEI